MVQDIALRREAAKDTVKSAHPWPFRVGRKPVKTGPPNPLSPIRLRPVVGDPGHMGKSFAVDRADGDQTPGMGGWFCRKGGVKVALDHL